MREEYEDTFSFMSSAALLVSVIWGEAKVSKLFLAFYVTLARIAGSRKIVISNSPERTSIEFIQRYIIRKKKGWGGGEGIGYIGDAQKILLRK